MFVYCNNRPSDSFDEDGHMQMMRKDLGAYGGGGGGIIAGMVTMAAAVVQGVAYLAKQASKAVVKAVSKTVKRATEKKHVVYHLVDENTKTVEYVGRTCNVDKRKAAHALNPNRAGLKMNVVATNLNYAEARALEQISMTYHHTINTANKMNNQINGVSPKGWGLLAEIGKGTLNYAENKITNEILWWAGR